MQADDKAAMPVDSVAVKKEKRKKREEKDEIDSLFAGVEKKSKKQRA
jgi:hypothetical protein